MKLNVHLFSSFIRHYYISIGEFPNQLKLADVMSVCKKKINVIIPTTGQLVYFRTFPKFMRKLYVINFVSTSKTNIY